MDTVPLEPTPEDPRKVDARQLLALANDPDLADAPPGSGDRYTPQGLSRKGGMGQVWPARDEQLGRTVALKRLQEEYRDQDDLRRRFLNEAQITAQLQHPGIVPVYELVASGEDGSPYYTMRWIEGKTLTERVCVYHDRRPKGQAGRVEMLALLQAFVSVCQTLAYAHTSGGWSTATSRGTTSSWGRSARWWSWTGALPGLWAARARGWSGQRSNCPPMARRW
jgi:hypothetical protein